MLVREKHFLFSFSFLPKITTSVRWILTRKKKTNLFCCCFATIFFLFFNKLQIINNLWSKLYIHLCDDSNLSHFYRNLSESIRSMIKLACLMLFYVFIRRPRNVQLCFFLFSDFLFLHISRLSELLKACDRVDLFFLFYVNSLNPRLCVFLYFSVRLLIL